MKTTNIMKLFIFISVLYVSELSIAQQMGGGGQPDRFHARANYSLALNTFLGNWDAAAELHGLTSVTVGVEVGPDGPATSIQARCPKAFLGPLPLGSVDIGVESNGSGVTKRLRAQVAGEYIKAVADLNLAVGLEGPTGALMGGSQEVTGSVRIESADLAGFTAAWPWLNLTGNLTATVTLSGPASNPAFELRAQAKGVSWRGEPVGDIEFSWKHEGRIATLDGLVIKPHPVEAPSPDQAPSPTSQAYGALKAELPVLVDFSLGEIRWLDREPGRVSLTAKGITPQLVRPLWQAPGNSRFLLDLSVQGQGRLDDMALKATLTGWFEKLGNEPVAAQVAVEIGPSSQTLRARLGEGLATLAMESRIPLVAVRRDGAPVAPSPLSGKVELGLPLSLLAPYVPSFLANPEGLLAGKVELGGTVGEPLLDGTVVVQEGEVTIVPFNRRVRGFTAQAELKGTTLELRQLDGSSAKGKLAVTGILNWVPTSSGSDPKGPLWSTWSADGRWQIGLEDFPMVTEGLPVGLLDASVLVTAQAGPGERSFGFVVKRSELRLTNEELPGAQAIPANDAVFVVDDEQAGSIAPLSRGAVEHEVFDVEFAESMKVTGPGVALEVGGAMRVERLGQVVRVEGGLDVGPGGEMGLFNNRFNIVGGRMSLGEGHLGRAASGDESGGVLADPDRAPIAAPLEPVVDLAARAYVVDTHVLVRLVGPGRRPKLMLTSVPPLPEYQILTLLIMGRVDAEDHRDGEVRRVVESMVGRFHSPGLKKQLFDRMGVDNLGMGFGSSVSQPILTVGKQITRSLYVETVYRHNSPPDANRREGRVQYRLNSHWTVDSRFGDAAEGGFGLFWATSFGGPPLPPPPSDEWGRLAQVVRGDKDADGIEDPFDLCAGDPEDHDGFEDEDGCPDQDNDMDGILDAEDRARDVAETFNGFEDEDGAPDQPPPVPMRLGTIIRGFSYEANSADLPPEGQAVLTALAELMRQLGTMKVVVTGHTDDSGGDALNLRISLQRARLARARLIRLGISGERIEARGAGSSVPVSAEADPDSLQAMQRRIEIDAAAQ